MLIKKQVKKFTVIYSHYPDIPPLSVDAFELKLCYLKDGKLCQLVFMDKTLNWQKFVSFINSQEDLIPDMLITIEQALRGNYPLGSKVLLKYGTIYEIDTKRDVQIIKKGVLEAALKLS